MIEKLKVNFELKNVEFLNRIKMPFAKISDSFAEKISSHENLKFIKTAVKKTIEHPGSLQFPEDFNLKQDMVDHPDNLYVKALAIVADEPNDNGDFFSKEELKKSFHTFVGCPFFVNHKNDDVEEARGTILYAEWSDEENGIMVIGRVDAKAYPKLARGISEGYISGVSMGCFTGDMRVLMSDGIYKPIKDIYSGENVITHTGGVEEVLNVQIHNDKTDDIIYEVKVEGLPVPIKATKEHPFYTLKEQDKCFVSGELIGLPKSYDRFKKRTKQGMWQKSEYEELVKNENFTEFEWKECEQLKEGDMVSFPISNFEKYDKEATISNARLIGYFLAEGSYIKRKGEKVGIEFTFSLEEKDTLAKEVVDLLSNAFQTNVKTYEREEKNTIAIKVSSREIASWFYNYCSEYSHEKKISERCLYWPKNIQIHIIATFFNGDGYWRNIYDKRVNKYYSNISYTTASEALHNQLRFILSRLGIYSTSSCVNRKDRERPYYVTSISCKESESLKQYVKDGFIGEGYRKSSFRKTENYLVMPIKSISSYHNTEKVYNLEVANDNSFIVEGVAVHNCQVEYSECSICGNQAAKEDEYCLVAGSKILMSDNQLKDIEDIEIGDEVFTHDGSVGKVTETMIRNVNEEIYEIFSTTSNIPLETTGNHPLLVLNGKKNNLKKSFQNYYSDNFVLEWKDASNIEIGDYLVSPKNSRDNVDNTRNKIFARLLGLYLAEGCLFRQKHINGKKIYGIEFSISSEEIDLKNDILNMCLQITGKEARVYKKRSNVFQIRICDQDLSNSFYNLCGEYSRDKFIGEEIFNWSKENIQEFISGYIDGDGYYNQKKKSFYLRTASESIALQMQRLLSILNSWASIHLHENSENNIVKYVNQSDRRTYLIYIPSIQAEKIITSRCIKGLNFCETSSVDMSSHWEKNGYDIVRVRKIAKKEFDGEVFNFSVEGNESYIANNVVVHNCTHIKKHKTRKFNGKQVYEKNHGLKFIELSFVVDPACSTCFIQEIYDVDDLQEKIAQIQDFVGNFKKIASSSRPLTISGKEEINKLNEAENLIQEVAKTMLDQKQNLELSYVTDLVEALAKLQQTKDELIDMGYESLQTAPTSAAAPSVETTPPEQNLPPEQGQIPEEQNINYENTGAVPAGEVGKVTMPGPIASRFKNKLIKKSSNSLSVVFKNNLKKKWNKEQ